MTTKPRGLVIVTLSPFVIPRSSASRVLIHTEGSGRSSRKLLRPRCWLWKLVLTLPPELKTSGYCLDRSGRDTGLSAGSLYLGRGS